MYPNMYPLSDSHSSKQLWLLRNQNPITLVVSDEMQHFQEKQLYQQVHTLHQVCMDRKKSNKTDIQSLLFSTDGASRRSFQAMMTRWLLACNFIVSLVDVATKKSLTSVTWCFQLTILSAETVGWLVVSVAWASDGGQEGQAPLDFKIFSKKVIFLISRRRNQILPLLASPRKILKKSPNAPLEKFLPTPMIISVYTDRQAWA